MRLLLLLTMLLAATLTYSQGTTTAEYYEYLREQSFKKYMETTGSTGLSQSIKTSGFIVDQKAVDEFFELIKRRNQGNKVVETDEQKKAIRAQAQMDKIDAQIKADNEAEAAREQQIGLSTIRTLRFSNGNVFEGHYYGKSRYDKEPLFMTLVSGKMTYKGGGVYVGEFAKHYGLSYRWGYGVMERPNGEIYSGQWKEDFYHGFGKLKKANGDLYEGEFSGGIIRGFGRMQYADGTVKEGFWSNYGSDVSDEPPVPAEISGKDIGKKEVNGRKRYGLGKGRITGLGGVYKGEFRNYNMHGKGTIEFDNGAVYTGDLFYDAVHGKGIYKFPNGDIYEGSYIMNKRNGKGTYRWPEGRVYEGEWKDNQREGKGIMRYANGDIYDGEWINNNPSGFGKMTYANGRVEEGRWKDGKYIREKVSFSNWETASKENAWTVLEVPDTDKNIHRYLADGKLKFKTKSGDYIWAYTNLGNAQPTTYQYEAVYEIEKQEYNNGQGGILIEIDEGNAPDYSKLLFMINPGAQTYYLGMYNHSKSSWTSFTSPEANGGWVVSSSLKGFSNKGVSTNKIRLQKTTDEITIYINDQLMVTQKVAISGRPLNKFAGIGIVQGGLLTGSISAIDFKSE